MQFHINRKIYVRCCMILMAVLFLFSCFFLHGTAAPSKTIGIGAGFSLVAALALSFVICGGVAVGKACKQGKANTKRIIKTSLIFCFLLSGYCSLYAFLPGAAQVLEIALWVILIAGLMVERLARQRSAG